MKTSSTILVIEQNTKWRVTTRVTIIFQWKLCIWQQRHHESPQNIYIKKLSYNFYNKKVVTRVFSSVIMKKILVTSGDSYGDLLVTCWWFVCWSTEHHYYWQNCLWKTPFSNQYFVLCPWHLRTLPIRLGIDSMVLSVTSVGKAKIVWIILFENYLKFSLARFLLTASSLSFLPIRWKTFSIELRSGERAGILNKRHPTFSIASLDSL